MKKSKILPCLMGIVSAILCIPSIAYLISMKTVSGFNAYYTYALFKTSNQFMRSLSGMIVIGLFLACCVLYFFIIKKEKEIFKSKKQIIIFIVIISFIYMLMLPFFSSDVYYYIGDGWLGANYHENPYYTTVKDLQDNGINDEVLQNTGHWKKALSIYGPLFNAIIITLSKLSFGNVTLGLFVFKVAAVGIHILNCYLIYKLTRSRKYMLIYGINPLVLLELLSNVHNDIYLILFTLLALYSLVRKKNNLATIFFMGLSVAVKYSTVLIVPFMLLYMYRKHSIPKRIVYCLLSGLAVIGIVVLCYLPFYRDMTVFTNMLIQDTKHSQSIMAIVSYNLQSHRDILQVVRKVKLPIFAIMYIGILAKLLFTKKLIFSNLMRKYNIVMLIFMFIILTTFREWYVLWLLPTMIWQSKNMRDFILALTPIAVVPSYSYFCVQNDPFIVGIYYSVIMLILADVTIAIKLLFKNYIKTKKEKKNENNNRRSSAML